MPIFWGRNKDELLFKGCNRLIAFCKHNNVGWPQVTGFEKDEWILGSISCAYYRPQEGVMICPDLCAYPTTEAQIRNWNWPCSVTDREPYGVIAHELGHHCDVLTGTKKGKYWSSYSSEVCLASGEHPITSYAPNEAEWFAEMFRLFITNPLLLKEIRPITYELLTRKWKPLPSKGWRHELGQNVPAQIVKTLINKGARPCT